MRGQERFAHAFIGKTANSGRKACKVQFETLRRSRVAAAPKDEVEVSYTDAAAT